MNVKLIINQEHNGLELYFADKPDESVLTTLKSASWRYHRTKRCWYARQNTANEEIARRFAAEEAADPAAEAADKPKLFMPPYDAVDDIPIFPSADISCLAFDEGYFADIKAYIRIKSQRIVIEDLRNALVPGKECERLILEPEDLYSPECLHSGLDTFRAVYDKFFVRSELPECRVRRSQGRSMQTFTPFKPIRPIQTPGKWTLPHVWKAILSGQIYEGHVDCRYTDDYALDAATDFRSGVQLHLPSFARELIERPSGWYVTGKAREDGTVELSVNCYSFHFNTLLFDVNCDWAENRRRRLQRIDEQDRHNADMKAQLLSFDQVREQTAEGLLFDATVLTMNQNTDRYETSSELLLRQQFMDEDHLWRDMIKVSVHPIAADALFEISCTPLLHADDRVMLYEDQAVVTGKALIELLTSPDTSEAIGSVNERRQTLAAFRFSLEDLRDGRIRNLFNPASVSRIQLALDRLEKEEERLHESV